VKTEQFLSSFVYAAIIYNSLFFLEFNKMAKRTAPVDEPAQPRTRPKSAASQASTAKKGGGFSSILTKEDFFNQFDDIILRTDISVKLFSLPKNDLIPSNIVPEYIKLTSWYLAATHRVLNFDGEKVKYFPVLSVLLFPVLLLQEKGEEVCIDIPADNSPDIEEDKDLGDDEQLDSELPISPLVYHEERIKFGTAAGPVEFLIKFLDKYRLVVEVKKALDSHSNVDSIGGMWQLFAQMYVAFRTNDDGKPVHGVLTNVSWWYFVKLEAKSNGAGEFKLTFSMSKCFTFSMGIWNQRFMPGPHMKEVISFVMYILGVTLDEVALERVQKINDDLFGDVQTIADTCLPEDVCKLKAENVEVKTENVKVKAENVKVQAENVEVKAENVEVKAENVKVQAENVEVKAEIAHLKAKIAAYEAKEK